MYGAESGEDVNGSTIRVSVKAELGTKGVDNSRNANAFRCDRDKGGGEERVAFVGIGSAAENSGGKVLQHSISDVVRASKGECNRQNI